MFIITCDEKDNIIEQELEATVKKYKTAKISKKG
jgi:hypothetical protein